MDHSACCQATILVPTRHRSNRGGQPAWRGQRSARQHLRPRNENQIRIKPILRERLEPKFETVVPSGPMIVSPVSSVDLFDDVSRAPNAFPRLTLATATDDLGDSNRAVTVPAFFSHGPTSQICSEISRTDGAELSETEQTQSCAKANPSTCPPTMYPNSNCGPRDSRSPLGQRSMPSLLVDGRCYAIQVLQAECFQAPVPGRVYVPAGE